jgi:hypothetical protein
LNDTNFGNHIIVGELRVLAGLSLIRVMARRIDLNNFSCPISPIRLPVQLPNILYWRQAPENILQTGKHGGGTT